MKLKFFLLTVTFSIYNLVYGQAENNTITVVDTSIDPAGYISEMKLPAAPLDGTVYLDEDWKFGTINFIGGNSITSLMLRYDIQRNNLEFIYQDDEAKVCPLYLLDSYQIRVKKEKLKFKNLSNTNLSKLGLKGVAEVLFSERVHLYAYTSLDVQDPTYKVEFNMGRQSSRIIKKRNYYLDNGTEAYKISGSLKKNKDVFKEEYVQLAAFAKENKLNARDEDDLIKIVTEYNKLMVTK